MRFRPSRLLIVFAVLVPLILAGCGSDDSDNDPTATVASTATKVPTKVPTEGAAVSASPTTATSVVATSSPAATVISTTATPGATPVASPASANSTPLAATPMTSDQATPIATDGSVVDIHGRVTLDGVENADYIVTEDGCIGIGKYASLGVGQQIVIRDAAGLIVGVATLEASDAATGCQWTFEVTVPVSDFYDVRIPMTAEYIFSGEDVRDHNGEIELIIP